MAAGLDADQFWASTPRLAAAVLQGAEQRVERERLMADLLAWNMAHLTGVATNNPKKFPDFDRFHRPARNRPPPRQSVEQMQAIAREIHARVQAIGEKHR